MRDSPNCFLLVAFCFINKLLPLSDEVVCPRSSAARKKGGHLNVFNLCIIYIYKLFYSILLFITDKIGYCLIPRIVQDRKLL